MNCPHCGVSWIGGLIPEDIRHHYSTDRWERQIGIDGGYMAVYDGIVAHRCPDCGEESPVNDSAWARDLFEKYQRAIATDNKMQEVAARNKDGV